MERYTGLKQRVAAIVERHLVRLMGADEDITGLSSEIAEEVTALVLGDADAPESGGEAVSGS